MTTAVQTTVIGGVRLELIDGLDGTYSLAVRNTEGAGLIFLYGLTGADLAPLAQKIAAIPQERRLEDAMAI